LNEYKLNQKLTQVWYCQLDISLKFKTW